MNPLARQAERCSATSYNVIGRPLGGPVAATARTANTLLKLRRLTHLAVTHSCVPQSLSVDKLDLNRRHRGNAPPPHRRRHRPSPRHSLSPLLKRDMLQTLCLYHELYGCAARHQTHKWVEYRTAPFPSAHPSQPYACGLPWGLNSTLHTTLLHKETQPVHIIPADGERFKKGSSNRSLSGLLQNGLEYKLAQRSFASSRSRSYVTSVTFNERIWNSTSRTSSEHAKNTLRYHCSEIASFAASHHPPRCVPGLDTPRDRSLAHASKPSFADNLNRYRSTSPTHAVKASYDHSVSSVTLSPTPSSASSRASGRQICPQFNVCGTQTLGDTSGATSSCRHEACDSQSPSSVHAARQ